MLKEEEEEMIGIIKAAVESSLAEIKWRLRPSSNRRLNTDIMALCSGMRSVIMIDYGGKLPDLQLRLSSFLNQLRQQHNNDDSSIFDNLRHDSSIFDNLRLMIVEDMIYLIHLKAIASLINSTLNNEFDLRYVDLQHDPPQMVTEIEKSPVGAQFLSLQKLFSSVFCGNVDSTSNVRVPDANNQPPCDVIDLSHLMQDTLVTLPTLNGWLLGYPVVYIFGKDHIEDAVYNLSTKSLHLFSIFVRRNSSSSKRPPEEELMSFSVPYDLSIDGDSEVWAEAFLARMKARWEGCKHVWESLRMEVSATYPQAIAL